MKALRQRFIKKEMDEDRASQDCCKHSIGFIRMDFILSIKTPERLCESENVTRAFIHKVVSSITIWVELSLNHKETSSRVLNVCVPGWLLTIKLLDGQPVIRGQFVAENVSHGALVVRPHDGRVRGGVGQA